MLKIAEASLISCVTAAVLAFGGTEPISFALIEVVLLGAAALVVFRSRNYEWAGSWSLAAIPAGLIALVALQLLPLPRGLLRWLRPDYPAWDVDAAGGGGGKFFSLSIAPYNTKTHFILLVCCVVAFFFARMLGQDRASRRRLMAWLLTLGTFEALYGLVQYLSGWQKIFGYVKKYNLEEATGTYINRNHFAGFLEMAIPFSLALVLYENSKRSRQARGVRRTFGTRAKALLSGGNFSRMGLRVFAALAMVAGLFFSRSRMGILAGVASLAVMAIFAGVQRSAGLWLAAGVMICGIGLVFWMGAEQGFGRFASIGDEYTSANESRLSLWKDTVRLIEGHPLLGSGLGTFPVAFTRVQSTFPGKFVNHAHNDYLEITSDLGIPAAVVFFSAIGFLLVRVARKAASGVNLGVGEDDRAAGDEQRGESATEKKIVTGNRGRSRSSDARFARAVAVGCVGSISAMLLHSFADFNLYIPANALLFATILGLAAAVSAADMGTLEARL